MDMYVDVHNQMNINDLPLEIFIEIFRFLSIEDLLLAASLVCWKWKIFAEAPEIWRNISVSSGKIKCVYLQEILNRSTYGIVALKFACCTLTYPIFDVIARECPKLEHLTFETSNLKPNELSLTYGQFYFIANLKKLNTLGIIDAEFDDRDLITISESCSQLRSLTVMYSEKVTSYGFSCLFNRCKELTSLIIWQCKIEDALLEALPKQLRKLSICCLRKKTPKALHYIAKLPKLTDLQIFARGLQYQMVSELQGLGSLHLDHCFHVNNACLKEILENNASLYYLGLGQCNIDDYGLHLIAKSKCRSTLKKLRFDSVRNISKFGMNDVLENCTQLRFIDLSYDDFIKLETISEWRLNYPSIHFSTRPYRSLRSCFCGSKIDKRKFDAFTETGFPV